MRQFGSQCGCIFEEGWRLAGTVGRKGTPTPSPPPQEGRENGEALLSIDRRGALGRRWAEGTVRGSPPTSYPSPQAGGEFGRVTALGRRHEASRHLRIPVPLVGRGTGWGLPGAGVSGGEPGLHYANVSVGGLA